MLETEQAAMQAVDVKECPIIDLQVPGQVRAIHGEAQHRIRAVAEFFPEHFDGFQLPNGAVHFQAQSRLGVTFDVPLFRFDLAPGDAAVLVGIQPDDLIQVNQRDVPLTGDARAIDGDAQVTAAALMGVSAAPAEEQRSDPSEPSEGRC